MSEMAEQEQRRPAGELSHRHLRTAVGVIGIGLPVALPVGNALIFSEPALEGSLSAYYHTGMRDVFVGALCAMGVFLLFYRYRTQDHWVTNLAGLLAIVVALVPTNRPGEAEDVTTYVHFGAAAALLLALAYISVFRFTRSSPGALPGRRRRARQTIYVICGAVIAGCVAIAAADALLTAEDPDSTLLFWLEAVAIVAFGVSWLVKGRTLPMLYRAGDPADRE